MADPATAAVIGAGIGAITNEDDPLKGAMMGAALGGGGSYLAGGLGAEAGSTFLTPASAPDLFASAPIESYASGIGLPGEEAAAQSLGGAGGTGNILPTSFSPMMAMQGLNLMKPQQQASGGGGVRPGSTKMLNDAVISLLAPKRVEKRKISLL